MFEEILQRKKGETDFEYKVRLCLSKINKELGNLKWEKLVKILGVDCSADHLRKLSYAYKEYSDYCKSKQLTSEDYALMKQLEAEKKLIAKQTIKLDKEKIKLNDQKSILRNTKRQEARIENLQKIIKQEVKRLNVAKELKPSKQIIRTSEDEMVILLSDWHIGLETSNYWNEFNNEVAYKRVSELIGRTEEIAKMYKPKAIHILVLGDMVNGIIHTTSRIESTENVVKQTIRVSEMVCDVCNEISRFTDEVLVYVANGNHDRVTANKNDNLDEESFSYLMSWFMQERFSKHKKIKLMQNEYDKGIVVTDICGHTVFGVHGDKDRPRTDRLSKLIKKFPSYIFMGHYHSNFEQNDLGVDTVVNGCLSGMDSYAKDKRLYSKPMQKVMIFSKKYGRLATFNIEFNKESTI